MKKFSTNVIGKSLYWTIITLAGFSAILHINMMLIGGTTHPQWIILQAAAGVWFWCLIVPEMFKLTDSWQDLWFG